MLRDVDAFQHFVVARVGVAQVVRHLVRVVQLGDGGGEMRLAGEQDVFGALGEVGLVLRRERGHGEGVSAEGVGVAVTRFQLAADGGDPDQMQA